MTSNETTFNTRELNVRIGTEITADKATLLSGEQVYNVTLDKTVNKGADYLKGPLYWHLDGTMNDVPILAPLLYYEPEPETPFSMFTCGARFISSGPRSR